MAKLTITLSSYIFLKLENVDEKLEGFLKKKLNVINPKFLSAQRMGFSVYKIPKMLYNCKKLKAGFVLPIGFLGNLKQYALENDFELEIADKRIEQPIEPLDCQIKLKPTQILMFDKILKYNRVVLEAKPGFGKTILALAYLTKLQQKTIIIVHTRALLHQWQKRIDDYFNLEENDVGIIGEGKWKIGKKITLASYQTLLSRGSKKLKNEFGLTIVDECHHVPAFTFSKVVRELASRYCLGLTATAFRKDRLESMMNFYLGPIVVTPKDSSITTYSEKKVPTFLKIRETKLMIEDDENLEFTLLGTKLTQDNKRNKLIVDDVYEVAKSGQKCLILTERVEHCQVLAEMLKKKIKKLKIAVANGQMKKSEREEIIHNVKDNEFDVLVATGALIGEGFDWPQLQHLFLVYPFSWRGKLIQYVGRAQRYFPGKDRVYVYDYLDNYVGMFKGMFLKRKRAYLTMGVKLIEKKSQLEIL
jgi:superfamily II DNA or RNA helicase